MSAPPQSGSAYVFQRDEGGADNWGELKKLTSGAAPGEDWFGHSVSIDGDTAIVGAWRDDDAGTDSGSAYVFQRDEGGVDNWGQVKEFTASDAAGEDRFGYSVFVSGDTAIVGATLNDDAGTNSGSAYIFQRDEGGADNWGEVKKLTGGGGNFGHSVSVSGDTAIVGAPWDDDAGRDSGSAYVYFSSVCGNGVVEGAEACDDGFTDDCGTCKATCSGAGTGSTCGDGDVCPETETCDDGGTGSGDGCSSSCTLEDGWSCAGEPTVCEEICGDGLIVGAEECDDGNSSNNDDCLDTCEDARCGDGFAWNEGTGTEECDDGNSSNNDDCLNTCEDASCGDGFVWNVGTGTEECDDGNTDDTDACVGECMNATCGDTHVWTIDCTPGLTCEECDDGNSSNNDDCLSICEDARCGDGFVWDEGTGTEECDDGNTDDTDACVDECVNATCGDTHVWTIDCTLRLTCEECDDGNASNNDDCLDTCEDASCGDSFVWNEGTGTEECDDENTDPDDGCDPNCHVYLGDHCAFAFEASLGANLGENTQFGPDDAEASCQPDSNNDAWFEYTAPCTATHLTTTSGSMLEPSNDTVLSVYDACGGAEIACDDDGGDGLSSELTFTATAETTYYIRVAGAGDNIGQIVLNISTLELCIRRRVPDRCE